MTNKTAKKPMARLLIFSVVILIMLGLLLSRLYEITIIEGKKYLSSSLDQYTHIIETRGKRGTVYDRNGLVLAYDETCYNVEFLRDGNNRSDYHSAMYTEALIKAIKIINEAGYETIDTSYIRMDETGTLYYEWGSKNEKTIKSRYKNFCEAVCGFSITDKIKDDTSKWISAEDAYLKLRRNWFIPDEMPFDEAVKIMSVRQEILLNNYQSYKPITIAYDVSMDVVAKLETMALPGVQTSQSTRRVYPYGETAAHIIGYCQKMTAENQDEYKKKGYAYDDYIGVSGVEKTMEEYLTACTSEHHGKIELKTNANQSVIEVVSVTPPTDGSSVMLTVDFPLQSVTENALRHIIENIHQKQLDRIDPDGDGVYDGEYAEYEDLKLAKSGAIVVLNVHNGDVLAMASYPSFDPNWFIQGLDSEQLEYLYGESAKDTTPSRNKAVSMKLAPGSIFKMCTGMAGLMENVIGLEETIDDESPYYVRDPETGEQIMQNPVKCWTKNPAKHKDQDISLALINSCNYYFCEVANRLGIERLDRWAKNFGFADSTGIELTGEETGTIGGQKALYDNTKPHNQQATSMPALVYRTLCKNLKNYQDIRGVESDDETIGRCAERLMRLQNGSLTGKGGEVRKILSEELGIPEGISRSRGWVGEITSLLNELQWKATLTIRVGIGQSILLVTPIAAARYAAAIANDGTVYNTHIIKQVTNSEGEVVLDVEPDVFYQIDAPKEYWDAIHKGMAGVVSPEDGGTASSAFSKEFADKGYLAKISGKTGSAQVGNVTVDIQNTSWFVSFAPNDDPDIAICVCIPNGLSGSSSAGAVEEILTYYFSKLDAASPETLTNPDDITP